MNAKVQDNNAKIIGLLQEAVNAEITSRNLYWARSVYWRSQGMSKLADYYLQQSQEDHAQRSADRMAFLGQQPAMEPTKVAYIDENSVAEQLRIDLQVEIELADGYAQWIKMAEQEGDYVTRQLWIEVLRSTQEHVQFLQGELRQMDLIGEDNYLASWRE
jgi:bacterioferritin